MYGLTSNKKKKKKDTIVAFLFMAPALILLIVFVFYPILFSVPLAFTDYSVIKETTFVGFDNFTRAFSDQDFWTALLNSVFFILVVPPLQILAIFLAIVVNKKIRGITFFKVLYYIPVVTSMIAVSIIWGFLFDQNGLINKMLTELHLISEPILFLADVKVVMFSLMFVTLWQGIGYYMMLYLAGLQSVPKDLEEAAHIDGANGFITFIKITLPMLKPYIWFCSLMSLLSAIGVFDVVFAMTDGGPDKASLVIHYYTYQAAFVNLEFGYSSAVGLLTSIITIALSSLIFIYGRKGGMNSND